MTCHEYLDLLEQHGVDVEREPDTDPPEYVLTRDDDGDRKVHVLECRSSETLSDSVVDAARRKLGLDDMSDDEFFDP